MMSGKEKISPRFTSQLNDMRMNFGKIYRNLPIASMIELSVNRNEGVLSNSGALSVRTGKFTGRSPDDKYIVDDNTTHKLINWGKVNHALSTDNFEKIYDKVKGYMSGKEFFIFDGFVGAEAETRLPVRVFTDSVWHNLFATQIFLRPKKRELEKFVPEFTLFYLNNFANPKF
jgi:phosphoenolpyruvate carboxykinase (ATP)